MLPNIDGFALCKKIREEHVYPIIMLTAKDTEVDKITGLALGADDYMTKPFDILELKARMKVILKRSARQKSGGPRDRTDPSVQRPGTGHGKLRMPVAGRRGSTDPDRVFHPARAAGKPGHGGQCGRTVPQNLERRILQ